MKKNHQLIITIGFILVVFLFLAFLTAKQGKSSSTLSDNLYFGGLDISGLDKDEAEIKIKEKCREMEEQGLTLKYGDNLLALPAAAAAFDADLSYAYFHYNTDAIKDALTENTRPGTIKRWLKKISGHEKTIIKPEFTVDQERIKKAVTEKFPEAFYQASDAAFIFNKDNIDISPEKPGKTVDWEKLFAEINDRLEFFKTEAVTTKTKTEYPEIYGRDLAGLESEADSLSGKPLSLNFQENYWPVNRETVAAWLYVRKQGTDLNLDFSQERIAKYLEEKISPKIDIEPSNPRFEIKNNKISSWQLGKNGYKLDAAGSAAEIIKQYTENNGQEKISIPLIVETVEPASAESFDIQEIIGTGHSNFKGSPANRRHNIKVGAEAVNGMIIKPGEEFSLVKTLGAIDASTGYLPELVIKNNKTIPEYGGGLCQIGTTVFRAALASGLPITARQNHSYRVSYYEPAGTDAAIYDPWPDVRFINDSAKSILIQSRIEGNDIYFDFWGTKDGRTASTSKPVVYNIVSPPPTKIIESDDLAPGEKKCTEKAHNGADAYFDYTVIYPEGATSTPEQTRRFKSHYVPWQEVCLVGKAASSTPPATEDSASPAPENSAPTEN